MLTFWDKIVAYLQNKANLRKVIITGAAVFLLLGVVLFSSQIQKLLNLPWPGRAAGPGGPAGSELQWTDLPSLNVARSNAKMIDVVEPSSNKRWLYAIGGIKTVDINLNDPNRPDWNEATETIELIKDVERLELNPVTGVPLPTASWETKSPMTFGRAEFGLIEYGGYIYAISGDIHMPDTDSGTPGDPSDDIEFPFLFSTMERLPISNLEASWETVALVSGVNFYPEVTIFDNQIQIVGGVFGNPFRTNAFNTWGGRTGQDPLMIKDDYDDWGGLSGLPKIGGAPIKLPKADPVEDPIIGMGTGSITMPGDGVIIQDYTGGDPQYPWEFDWWNPWITDNPWNNLSAVWSELLLNGEFYTTVSEHYILYHDTGNNLVELVENGSRELGVDYVTTETEPLYEPALDENFWNTNETGQLELLYNRVFKVGHIRIFLTSFVYGEVSWPMIMPAPQGRYGHKLITHNYDDNLTEDDELLVVGGASWSNPLVWLIHIYPDSYNRYVYSTFWVNDDALHPMRLLALPGWSEYEYVYVGNTVYKWSGIDDGTYSQWYGTNADTASFTNNGSPNTEGMLLSDRYALKNIPGEFGGNGRAFSGLAELDLSGSSQMFNKNGYVMTGGLANTKICPIRVTCQYDYYDRIASGLESGIAYVPINPTNRVVVLQPPFEQEWKTITKDPDNEGDWWTEPQVYNLSSIGIDANRSITFNGQTTFIDPPYTTIDTFNDMHVPAYTRSISQKTSMFAGLENWFLMPVGGTPNPPLLPQAHAAVHDVRVLGSDGKTINVVVYRVGGSRNDRSDWLPSEDSRGQYIGPFTYGLPGVPDPGRSIFTVVPEEVVADGVSSATATLVLLDYYGAPVVGTKAVVATDANSSWPPVSTDNIKIRPLVTDPPQVVPLGWPTPWLVTNANGTVQFKLTSLKEIPLDQVSIYISANGNPSGNPPAAKADCDPFVMPSQPITFALAGAVSDLNSTVEADPIKVIADGIDFSTVTVTLLDHQDPPQPVTGDYYVKILSNRNLIQPPIPGGDTDKIKIINQKTDSDGKATFEVRSSVRGEAIIYARYSLTIAGLDDPDSYISLTDTATITFGALISSLEPDQGLQGQLLDSITATGAATHWSSTPPNTTTVELIPPSKLSFYWINNDLEQDQLESNIDDLYLKADGLTIKKLGIWSQANPRTTVTFNILDNADGTKGSFWPGGEKDQISGITDRLGQATFSYQSGSTAGIVKICATIGGISDEAWLILHDARPNPYLLKIIADPTILNDTIRDSAIRAALYRYVGNQEPELITDPLTFHFVSDSDGTFSDETVTSVGGIAATAYTRSTTNGRVRIFAWVEGYESEELFLANKVVIYQKGGTAQISFMPPIVTDNFKLRIDAVNIGETADLGFWTFRAITPMGVGEDAEIVDYPFQVLPYDWNVTAKLTAIDPKVGIRGTNNLQVAITGQNTHFYKGTTGSSVVTFKPYSNPGPAEGIEVLNSTLVVVSDISLKITINIAHDAVVGFWNVQVTTGSEIATLAGNTDFLVADDSRGYFINLWAAPDHLARDGESTSKIDAWVGQVDPLTGRIRLINNVTVNFAKNDNGKLSANSAVTNSDGKATIWYTTDAGETNEIVTITGWASPEAGVLIAQWTDIYKEVYVLNYLLTAEPTELPLRGTAVSNLSITKLPGNRIPITLYFNGSPKGHLEPVSTTSDIKGEATSQYIAAPESERIQEVVRIYALATIPEFGQVRSNIVDIQIGRESSKYTLELSAVPDSVIAGGTLRSTVTAVLKHQTQPEPNWPIEFTLDAAGTGDYLTYSSVTTNTSGAAVTHFVPGNVVGAVIVKARPEAIPLFRQVIINKTADGYPDEDLSTISAVPSRCLLPDGVAFSVVTITLRNSNYVPVVGRQVRLSTNHSGDTIKLADGTTATSTNTNSQGKAIFHISSTMVGTSNVTAKFDADFDLITDIIFEALGVCIPQKLDLTVPFEIKDYDNLVLVYVTENGLTNGDFVNEVYTKSARPLNKIDELKNIMLYLHPNKTYTVWVKGRYHLAKTKLFTTGSIGNDPIPLIFDELLIADIRPDWSDIYEVSTPFRDNAVNAIDYWLIWQSWFADSYLADFTSDGQVNSLDFYYLWKNYGKGALGGPPPLYDR